MIADNSETILALLAVAVRRGGYEPVLVADGDEALAAFREHEPELVILDAVMPGSTGFEVCRAIRDEEREGRRTHVILLSAGSAAGDPRLADEAGADEFLAKPFSPSDLRDRVAEILGEP